MLLLGHSDTDHERKAHRTCAALAKYYNSCNFFISEDIGIDKSKTHSKQWEGNYADKNLIISNIKM